MKTINELLQNQLSERSSYSRKKAIAAVSFSDMKISTIKAAGNATMLVGVTTNGYKVHITVKGNDALNNYDKQMTCYCECKDFELTFMKANHDNGCLFGGQTNLNNITLSSSQSRNPTMEPGMCKHLLKAIESL